VAIDGVVELEDAVVRGLPARDCIEPHDRISTTAFATDGFSATFSTRIAPPPPLGCIAEVGGWVPRRGILDWGTGGGRAQGARGFEISSLAKRFGHREQRASGAASGGGRLKRPLIRGDQM
jgi:hypothetical protein